MRLLTVLLASSICLQAQSKPLRPIHQTPESTIQDVQTVAECTDRMWPGFTWKGQNFLAVDPKRQSQLAYNVDSKKIYLVPNDQVAESASTLSSSYNFISEAGQEWVSVNREFTKSNALPNIAFALGAHESFHHLFQKNWKIGQGSRGTRLPIRWEPRYYRAFLYKNLKSFLLNGNEQDLQKARYWFDRWKSEFSEETSSVTDGYEGSAMYVEKISKILARDGCQVSEARILEKIRDEVRNSNIDLILFRGRMGLDSEGYYLGSVAGFILRWMRPQLGWEARLSQDKTPVEILLEKVTPLFDEGDEEIAQSFEKTIQEHSAKVAVTLAPANQALEDGQAVIIGIPYEWRTSSTSFNGFYIDTAKSMTMSVVGEALQFKEKGTDFQTDIEAVSVGGHIESPCRQSGVWDFPVRGSEIIQSDSRFEIKGEKVHGTVVGVMRTSGSGQKWLCADEK